MSDPLSTLFSAVQRESYRDTIGEQDYDRRTYETLYGTGEPTAQRQRLARRVLGLAVLLAMAGLACLWLLG
jgi:hypothetical protein